jgi:hypothetical protein
MFMKSWLVSDWKELVLDEDELWVLVWLLPEVEPTDMTGFLSAIWIWF